MNDNKTAHMSAEYDQKVSSTIPNYELFHRETIDLVKTVSPKCETWLDTGCGTGTFAICAMDSFKDTQFLLADPSNEMLAILNKKIEGMTLKVKVLGSVPSHEISLPDSSVDVITAIQSHHYYDVEGRKSATRNSFRMLKPGGIYVTFENIRPLTDKGTSIGLERWKHFQMSMGKSEKEAQSHIERFGNEYFPITIEDHLKLLRDAGFSTVEIFWYSYMQAGFYAIK
ncbi:MAG TPA: class I SAM-dependent methyltransferase [Clostridia bacterium]